MLASLMMPMFCLPWKKGPEAVRHIGELDALGRRQISWELADGLGHEVADACIHRDAAVLDLDGAAAQEVLLVAVRGEVQGVPEAVGRLDAQLVLERSQRRGRVERPIAPRAASKTILEKHADDRHHGQAAVRQLRIQALLPQHRIRGGEERGLPAAVAGVAHLAVGVVAEAAGALAEEAVGQDLQPTGARHLGDGSQAIRHVSELNVLSH
mmetsp:Transcript_100218/g.287925  ORF Transcript_100218/g.287925 Transcript_100218/m.287925 type:complete len:211 (+) Transcript_100218:299-931(+)